MLFLLKKRVLVCGALWENLDVLHEIKPNSMILVDPWKCMIQHAACTEN